MGTDQDAATEVGVTHTEPGVPGLMVTHSLVTNNIPQVPPPPSWLDLPCPQEGDEDLEGESSLMHVQEFVVEMDPARLAGS